MYTSSMSRILLLVLESRPTAVASGYLNGYSHSNQGSNHF
eukprot:COSAG05_NODE_7803_length_767_cov_1.854790_1_plen_39_part_10